VSEISIAQNLFILTNSFFVIFLCHVSFKYYTVMDPIHCKTVSTNDYCWIQDITGVYLQPVIHHYDSSCSNCRQEYDKETCNNIDIVYKLLFHADKPFEPHFLNTHNKSENALTGDALYFDILNADNPLTGEIYMSVH